MSNTVTGLIFVTCFLIPFGKVVCMFWVGY